MPSGPWTVEHADAMCLVGRKFGTGEREIALGFRPGPMSEHIRIALWLTEKGSKVSRGTATVSIDGRAPITAPYVKGPIGIKGLNLIQVDTTRPEIGSLDTAKILHIRAGEFNEAFSLGKVAGAMKALGTCEKDLLVSWGMDRVTLESIVTPAYHRNIYMLFSTNDYPSAAIAKKERGTAGVHYRIGMDGKVSDCRVVESSGSATLDARTCAIIVKRARYEPARNKAGEPVASIGFQRIRWEVW